MHEIVVRAGSDIGVCRFPCSDGDIELRAARQRIFEPLYFGDLADLMRNLGEDVVIERVSTDKVAKSGK